MSAGQETAVGIRPVTIDNHVEDDRAMRKDLAGR